ncbi:hypothetical protein [Scytonema hofmannii]|uniref:hypothetical protein n=1 Tax=Scytonema hofmannii TaxID=34078 RepID=UPI00131484FF|nr:hypothetical protein [Scytonema hofmannii]
MSLIRTRLYLILFEKPKRFYLTAFLTNHVGLLYNLVARDNGRWANLPIVCFRPKLAFFAYSG